jgi:hypothetical protein
MRANTRPINTKDSWCTQSDSQETIFWEWKQDVYVQENIIKGDRVTVNQEHAFAAAALKSPP